MSAWSSTTRIRPAPGSSVRAGRDGAGGSPASGSHHSASATDSVRSSGWLPEIPAAGRWSRPSGTATSTANPALVRSVVAPSVVTEPPSSPTSSATRASPTPPSSGCTRVAPVAATRSTAVPFSRRSRTVIRPPEATARVWASSAGTTCSHIARSTTAGSPRSGQSRSSDRPACSIAGRNMSTRPAVSGARSTGSRCGSTCPAYSRESSSSRSTIRRRRCALRCTSSRSARSAEPGAAASRSSATGPRTRLSGVRNWSLIPAKNAVLVRSSSVRCSARRCCAAKAPAATVAVETWWLTSSRNARYSSSSGR